MGIAIVIVGGLANLWAIGHLLNTLVRNTSDWSGRPTIFACLIAVVGLLAATVTLVLLGRTNWAAVVAAAPLVVTAGALGVVLGISLLAGGRWN